MLILNLLKPGGRAAIVLPDGTLFGEGVKTRIKEKLLTECNLHTVVRLPNGVFAPYTGIKTNLLFFTKGEPTKAVWYYEHPYPPGAKSYNKTKPIRIAEFDIEKAWWFGREGAAPAKPKKGKSKVAASPVAASFHDADSSESWNDSATMKMNRIETPQAWRVPVEQIIAAGYNLDIKNPHDAGEGNADPDELLIDYQRQLADLQQTRDRLKQELLAAFYFGVR